MSNSFGNVIKIEHIDVTEIKEEPGDEDQLLTEPKKTDKDFKMGSTSDDNERMGSANCELQFLAEEVAAAPVILQKSQIPRLKRRKDDALEDLIKKYEASFGKSLKAKHILKKINNMKSRLKKKTDRNQTGNKGIRLLDWEKKLLKVMEGDHNPTIARIEGAMQVGIDEHVSVDLQQRDERREQSSYTKRGTMGSSLKLPLLPPKKKSRTENYETDETRHLTTKELQRLVLLQQYKTSKVQMEYYKTKLQNLQLTNEPVLEEFLTTIE